MAAKPRDRKRRKTNADLRVGVREYCLRKFEELWGHPYPLEPEQLARGWEALRARAPELDLIDDAGREQHRQEELGSRFAEAQAAVEQLRLAHQRALELLLTTKDWWDEDVPESLSWLRAWFVEIGQTRTAKDLFSNSAPQRLDVDEDFLFVGEPRGGATPRSRAVMRLLRNPAWLPMSVTAPSARKRGGLLPSEVVTEVESRIRKESKRRKHR